MNINIFIELQFLVCSKVEKERPEIVVTILINELFQHVLILSNGVNEVVMEILICTSVCINILQRDHIDLNFLKICIYLSTCKIDFINT